MLDDRNRGYNDVYRETTMKVTLFRTYLGLVLRTLRREQGLTLRDVAARASVSYGYLSEVERGRKEISSEMLGSICDALNMPLWEVLDRTARSIALPDRPPA